MCKAHILRFSCSHGVLMSLEPCRSGPCPVLKTTGMKLPQQPTKCYNCQNKVERGSVSSTSTSSRHSSCRSSQESLTSASTAASSSSSSSPPSNFLSKMSAKSSLSSCSRHKPSISGKSGKRCSFSFACNGSDHAATPHYTALPEFLPHQDHACPPCQLEGLRTKSDTEVVRIAMAEYPNLKAEMLVRDGRIWEEWQGKPSLDKYIEEKRTEDREMWLHVTRKWTQDLKKSRVLVSEEDGLGLLA